TGPLERRNCIQIEYLGAHGQVPCFACPSKIRRATSCGPHPEKSASWGHGFLNEAITALAPLPFLSHYKLFGMPQRFGREDGSSAFSSSAELFLREEAYCTNQRARGRYCNSGISREKESQSPQLVACARDGRLHGSALNP